MNIFKIPKYIWWENMDILMQNVNLDEIKFKKNNHIEFTFSNSYNGDFYKNLDCIKILKCCIENDFYEDEVFSYFIADVYIKELNVEEVENSLTYYKYGYNMNVSNSDKLYLILINGNEVCMEIICEKYELHALKEN